MPHAGFASPSSASSCIEKPKRQIGLKDEFLSTLSHELRTPLNAIFGWARILRGRNLDTSTAHAVEVIERNAEAQVRLIEDVLDVSRIVKGKMTLELAPLDLAAVVRDDRHGSPGNTREADRPRRATRTDPADSRR